MRKIFRGIYKFFDKILIVPISRIVYNIQKSLKKNGGVIEKLLNRPKVLIYLSLILAVVFFLLINTKVVTLVENNAEVITNVPVVVKYNEEAYVVEGVPETVDITITGRKSDIYLAEQLGDFEVYLDLTDYTASDTAYKVYFTYSKNVNNLTYKLDPSYVSVVIKNKVSSVASVTYELINQDKLDEKLNVKNVKLSKSEVVVKGSETTLEQIAWVKALVDLSDPDLSETGSHEIDNVKLVAYDNTGNILNNVEVVPNTLSATVDIDSYSTSVPIEVKTKGKLLSGKAISSIKINGDTNYALTIYGKEDDISSVKSIPVTINIDGMGSDASKTYTVSLTKPTGVRYMSEKSVNVELTFGDEVQKEIKISNVAKKNLASGLSANLISDGEISVICKGVSSVIENITEEDINAYVDLSNVNVGDNNVEVKIDNSNPLVTYEVSSKIAIRVTNE